jgi:hypothetical protein
MRAHLKPGDFVIYSMTKSSVHPGAHAKDVYPAPHGDLYSYYVPKYWTVIAVGPDPRVTVCTRRGKQRTVDADDPALRRARWWEGLLFRRRFPRPVSAP